MCKLLGCCRLGLLAIVSAVPALAQVVPPSVQPGVQQRRLEPPRVAPQAQPPRVTVPDTGAAAPPPGAEQVRFPLQAVTVTGNTVFPESALADTWQPSLGREVSLADLYRIAAAITVRYRNAGYILSRAVVPAQEITDGRATIIVVEGWIDNVVVEGEVKGSRRALDHATRKITASRPLRADVLERYMLLLNDLAGVDAQSILRPSPVEPGASELVIVWEETRFGGSLSLDNFGTRFLGPLEVTATGVANNLYRQYDSTELRGLVTAQIEELQYVAARHSVPITPEGTLLALEGSYTWSEPQELGELRGIDTDGRSAFGALLLTHPLIRTRARNLSLFGGFRAQNSDNRLFGTTTSRDRTRVLTAGATFDLVDRFSGVTLFGVDVVQGLDILGARDGESDPPPSRPDADPSFTRLAASIIREQDLGGNFSLRVALSGQYAFDPLVASEQYGIGGEIFGRGYGPFEIAGDHGLAGKIQLQYGRPWQFDRLADVVESYLAYVFYDAGVVWQKNADDGDDHDQLSSAGLGVDLNLARGIAATAIVAQPLTRDPTTLADSDERYPRFFFRLTKRF